MMEPYPKRQRLYAQLSHDFPQSFEDEETYYDETPDSELVDDEEEEEESDPDATFAAQRARLDHKLKSTFESIFEKYGKDFDGIGDEVDLATGEVVVNNGHLLQMENERDAGDLGGSRILPRGYSEEITETEDDFPNSSIEGTENLEFEDEEFGLSDGEGEMVEDDMILRGFTQANRLASPELGPYPPPERRPTHVPRSHFQSNALSQSDILAQFGPQLGPKIMEYISQQEAEQRVYDEIEPAWQTPALPTSKSARRFDDSHIAPAWRAPALPRSAYDDNYIEPAWRAPPIPNQRPRKRPIIKSIIMPPEVEKSPSPEAHGSVWGPSTFQRRSNLNPFRQYGTDSMNQAAHSGRDDHKKTRRNFTEEEDDIMVEWTTRARNQGIAMSSQRLWQELAAKYPRHNWQSWYNHYKNLARMAQRLPDQREEAEASISGTSDYLGNHAALGLIDEDLVRNKPAKPIGKERPNRIRKPAQTNSNIISWYEAVDAIESLDPELHAGILEDSRETKFDDWTFNNNIPSTTRRSHDVLQKRLEKSAAQEIDDENDRPSEYQHSNARNPQFSEPIEIEDTPEPEQPLIPSAPCPHADCRHHSGIMYRLQRQPNEDLSEMCLHLFRAHHTTPFPCGEVDCTRKGEEGYFMQADLVRHVKFTHNHSALQRLRGRVDSDLLNRKSEFPKSTEAANTSLERPISQQRDSDFMSPARKATPRNQRSSILLSPSSDPNLTLTPRDTTELFGKNTTPMTSVSSMMVNHSSKTTIPIRERSQSQQSAILDAHIRYRSQPKPTSSMAHSFEEQSGALVAPFHQDWVTADSTRSEYTALPTPGASSNESQGRPKSFEGPRALTNSGKKMEQEIPGSSSSSRKSISLAPRETVHAKLPAQNNLSSALSYKTAPDRTDAIHSSRNHVDPSYEFSDDEAGVPSHKQTMQSAMHKQAGSGKSSTVPIVPQPTKTLLPLTKSKPNSRPKDKVKAVLPTKTPARTKPRKSILSEVLDTDDMDELSLGDDDFVLMSARPRTNPRAHSIMPVKIEDNSPIQPSFITKKRKLSMFVNDDEDELCFDDPSASTATTRIKKEVDYSPSIVPSLSKNKPAKASNLRQELPARSNTPLLDLTASRKEQAPSNLRWEIRDSATDSSPILPNSSENTHLHRTRNQRGGAESSSPLAQLLTPVRKKGLRGAEGINVAVFTPGGTLRRCGEDEFRCGRSFCFRCGAKKRDINV